MSDFFEDALVSLEIFHSDLSDLPKTRDVDEVIDSYLYCESSIRQIKFRPEAEKKIRDLGLLIHFCLFEIRLIRKIEAEHLRKQQSAIIRKYSDGIYAEQNLMPMRWETKVLACNAVEDRLLQESQNSLLLLRLWVEKSFL